MPQPASPTSASRLPLADLNRLFEIGQSFGAVTNINDLLKRVARAALTLTPAASSTVLLTAADGRQQGGRAVRSAGSPPDLLPLDPAGDPFAAHVMRHCAPLSFPPGPDSGWEGEPPDWPVFYAPLVEDGRAVGVLGAAGEPGGPPFSEHDCSLLMGLASFAAIALVNAWLHQQTLTRATELSLLVESSNALSSSLDLKSVLNAIARHMMRALSTHWCIISSWEPDSHRARRQAEVRLAIWPPGAGPVINRADYPCHDQLLRQDRPLAMQICRDEASPAEQSCLDVLGVRRVLTLPLQIAGRIIGLVEVSSLHESEPFQAAQVNQALRVALELALRLAEPAEQSGRIDLIDLARLLASLTGSDWCSIYTWEPGSPHLVRVLSSGAGFWFEQDGPVLDVGLMQTLSIVMSEQRIAVLRSTAETLSPAERALFADVGPSAMLALPVTFRGGPVGLVQLYDLNPAREFSPRELALAYALANQAAISLENAHLVRDLQRSLEEQRAMQSSLVYAARLSALGELSTVVAHQINNPLTTILGDADILAQDLPPGADSYESARAILRAGKRAKQVVERLLAMARAEEEPRPLDVNHTIRETLELVTPQIVQAGIRFELLLDDHLPPVLAIPGQLEDIWMNLLLNARDALVQKGDRDGVITIASNPAEGGSRVMVTVTDTGVGIPPEQIEQVFDPQFTTKPRGEGTGLGLYISRQIVINHNGSITVQSVPGTGTTVTVTLPAAPPSAEEIPWPPS